MSQQASTWVRQNNLTTAWAHCLQQFLTWHVLLGSWLKALRSKAMLRLLLVQHGLCHRTVALLHLLHRLYTASSSMLIQCHSTYSRLLKYSY